MKNDDDIKLLFRNCYFAGLMGNPNNAFDDFDQWYATKQKEVKKLHLHSVSKRESIKRRALLLAFTKEAFKPTYDFYKPEQIVDDWLSKQ